MCVCVCARARVCAHFPFFHLPDTRKNFRELLHPFPGCMWRDTHTHTHTHTHVCTHVHSHTHTHIQGALLRVVPRPDRKLDSGKLQPHLWHKIMFFVAVHSKEQKVGWVGTVYVQKRRFCQKYPVQLRACPGVACPSSGGLRRPTCAPGSLSRSGGSTLQVGPCPGVLGQDHLAQSPPSWLMKPPGKPAKMQVLGLPRGPRMRWGAGRALGCPE